MVLKLKVFKAKAGTPQSLTTDNSEPLAEQKSPHLGGVSPRRAEPLLIGPMVLMIDVVPAQWLPALEAGLTRRPIGAYVGSTNRVKAGGVAGGLKLGVGS